jgi:hypothetical protein
MGSKEAVSVRLERAEEHGMNRCNPAEWAKQPLQLACLIDEFIGGAFNG